MSVVSKADDNKSLQLRLGESVSIYSEKAYRRDGGKVFEAVGNVVISSGKDTLYGESASIDMVKGKVVIEGSVRFVGQNVTLYGSKINYNMNTSQIEIQNARMITPDFSIVAAYLLKKSENVYYATEAEFTTCRDCTESWQVFGKELNVEIGEYVKIDHALMKLKGVDVLYFPYLILPIKNNRESGLLFPITSTLNAEGISYQQPIFWNISDHEDMTITPGFLASRGYGLDLQYRKYFGESQWVEFNNKMVNDKIYYPLESNTKPSGPSFFRHIFELESHFQSDLDTNHHLQVIGMKDLDFIDDFYYYTKNFDYGSDFGLIYYGEKRFDTFSVGLESDYRRNLLSPDPLSFDSSYVQTLPRINLSLMPHFLWQNESSFFFKGIYGFDGDVTHFRQNRIDESGGPIRNAIRLDAKPYFEMSLLNLGPVFLKSKYSIDYQEYKFDDDDESKFYKNAGLVTTELSFSIDRIFGLAYEEKYNIDEIEDKDAQKISNSENEANKNILSKNIIGKLSSLESAATKEIITVKKNSYRHSQEFKFIHYQMVHDGLSGNTQFKDQIQTEAGWFDYQDAIKTNLFNLASNQARIMIPLNNTLEFQWNNSLIRKRTRNYNYLLDNKFLKDNFVYDKLGYFNVSQGILLEGENDNFKNSLTRLHVDSAYGTSNWSVGLNDYYNHQSSDHILSFYGERKFDRVNLLGQYRYNSYDGDKLRTIRTGLQFRPIDFFGVSFLKEYDLEANQNISAIYQVDFIPNNNCWILNFRYQEIFDNHRFAFTLKFNFGQDQFKDYSRNFFNFTRLQ